MKTLNHQVFKTSEVLPPIPKGAVRALAFDPSLTCTGFALCDVFDDGRMPSIALRRFGYIEPAEASEAELWPRAFSVAYACGCEVRQAMPKETRLDALATEMPMTHMAGMRGEKRSTSWLPSYGVICGAVAAIVGQTAASAWTEQTIGAIHPHVSCPSATLWSSGFPTGGKGKPNRIAMAKMMTGTDLVTTCGKSRAENVADAILLARWAAIKYRVEVGH